MYFVGEYSSGQYWSVRYIFLSALFIDGMSTKTHTLPGIPYLSGTHQIVTFDESSSEWRIRIPVDCLVCKVRACFIFGDVPLACSELLFVLCFFHGSINPSPSSPLPNTICVLLILGNAPVSDIVLLCGAR